MFLRLHVPQTPPLPYSAAALSPQLTHKFPGRGEKLSMVAEVKEVKVDPNFAVPGFLRSATVHADGLDVEPSARTSKWTVLIWRTCPQEAGDEWRSLKATNPSGDIGRWLFVEDSQSTSAILKGARNPERKLDGSEGFCRESTLRSRVPK
jgi:hypothetical protein